MSRKPLVGVSATTAPSDGIVRVRTNVAYVRAVEAAGLVPLVLAPLDAAEAARVLDPLSGLVLTGGEDVAPHHFGERPHPALGAVNEERDRWELALVAASRARSLPVLAICRGIQVLNVALGGSLVQDIPSQCPAALPHAPAGERGTRIHDVVVEPDSLLAEVLGADRVTVNSIHHQSIARPAKGLRVSGRAPDGIIEGVEWHADDWWAVGVQWHPEELIETPESWDRGLFASFAARCQK